MKKNREIEAAVSSIIKALGENGEREGLKDTPRRVAEALRELTEGYSVDPKSVLDVEFNETSGMVVSKDIEFFSLCEHHMLPFFGKVHIGYVPRNKVVGISKLARLVEVFSKRLQLQERMTKQVADSIDKQLSPLGVIVVVEAEHLCMKMRGAKTDSKILTSELRGLFEDFKAREEFFELLRLRSGE
ncbi:MAG: GTP cyclohydrolase I FolE [Thaumarchaeota archaeon]|nr:GTP cyclohydrolase I FolE [Nitrososphaerota archaeon]